MQGRPEVEEFIARCLLAGRDRIDFFGLPVQLKLELQYAVQCRADQAMITLPAPVVAWTIRRAGEAEVTSLLDQTAQWWADGAGPKTSQLSGVPRLRPRRRGDAARGHRLAGGVSPRRLATGAVTRVDRQRWQDPRAPQVALRPHRSALDSGAGQTPVAAAAVPQWPSAPSCPTSRR